MPQLTTITTNNGLDLYFRCPYHATVMKRFERIRRPTGSNLATIGFCISRSNSYALVSEKALHITHRVFAEVKNARCQHRVCFALDQHLRHVLEFTGATTGNYRHSHRLADPTRNLQVESCPGAVRIDAIQDRK